jgi:hypothetical protein
MDDDRFGLRAGKAHSKAGPQYQPVAQGLQTWK